MPASQEHRNQGPAGSPLKSKRLLIRPGAIGDIILSLPALEYLGGEVWAPAPVVPLIRFAKPRALSSTGIDLVGFGDTRALDLFAQYEDIWSWYAANRPEFHDEVRGLPFRFLKALPEGPLHATDFYLSQVGAPLGAIPRIPVPRNKGGFIACHPFSGSPKKNWPLERFLELNLQYCVGPEQHLAGAVQIDDLYELAHWLASADAYVGNDSGITHLAAAVGTPTLALFGPTDPNVWAPRGERVTILRRDRIDEITVQEVRSCLEHLLR